MATLLAIVLLAQPARAESPAASYPEGPVWIDGTLYWAEMGADRVMVRSGSGGARVFFERAGCGPTALARYREAEFLVLCHRAGMVARVDAAGRELGTIREDGAGHRLRDPNDASADGSGGVWFTDPGIFRAGAAAEGAVYYLAPDGRLTRRVTGLAYGNGIHVDRVGGRLFVSEHLARRVLVWPLDDGRLGEPRVFMDLRAEGVAAPAYPEAGPDGLELAPDGTLWVAEYGAGRLLGFREGEGVVAMVAVPEPFVTSIAFGPRGQAAVTSVAVNDRVPFPGTVRILPAARLTTPEAFRP